MNNLENEIKKYKESMKDIINMNWDEIIDNENENILYKCMIFIDENENNIDNIFDIFEKEINKIVEYYCDVDGFDRFWDWEGNINEIENDKFMMWKLNKLNMNVEDYKKYWDE